MDRPEYDLPDPELVIELDPPIERKGGGEVTSITLREPTAGQLRAAQTHFRAGNTPEAQTNFTLSLIASVSGVSREVVDKLPITIMVQASDYLVGFIMPPQKIG